MLNVSKTIWPVCAIEAAIGEHHRDVVVGERRQPEARALVAGVVVVEQQIVTEQSLVDVLRGEALAMVVVPERAQAPR